MDCTNPVLDVLLEHAGAFVSEQALAHRTAMHQTDIRKQIAGLRRKGFQIDTGDCQGYRLAGAPERLYPELVAHRLGTSLVARTIVYAPEIDSTNRAAKDQALQGAREGTMVVAEHQRRGRGRLDRRWTAPPGSGILCSLIFYPDLPVASAFRMTMLASVAVARTISAVCGLDAGIKWPNDVYVNGRKVCGVLTECLADHDRMRYCVIGIGINVLGGFDDHPQLAGIATSLSAEAGHAVSRLGVLRGMLRDIDTEYARFSRTQGRHLLDIWERFSLVRDREVTLHAPGEPPLRGIARGITADGHLLLRDEQGLEHTVLCGDISLRT
jgi:BirA family biotin operon repressor/biotin-[acetyl-CoA-carboxylase] ligase